MKVLFAASEAAPFIKTGGLADVCGTLPLALAKAGVSVRVILPKYRLIDTYFKGKMKHVCHFTVRLGWREQYCGIEMLTFENVKFYFVDNEYYFGRDNVYGGSDMDECERFSFFNKAVVEALPKIGFTPDIIHCNDWQCGMIPALIKMQYSGISEYSQIKTVFTIHNLRYQGLFPWEWITDLLSVERHFFTPEYIEFFNCVSFLKAGIVFSDKVSTVSPTYAKEITTAFFGERLDGVLRGIGDKLVGILNGIDLVQYDPATDEKLCTNFSIGKMDGKKKCKEALQDEMRLEKRPDVPLIAMVTRFADHKGLELVEHVLDDILRQDVQLAVLGIGSERYANLFRNVEERYRGKVSVRLELNGDLARRIYGGSDIFLMPSLFEPCGISQMFAMRYGSIPIVRETGGLKDSVKPYNKFNGEGTGFSFANYNAHELLFAIERAVDYYHRPDIWQSIVKQAMEADFGWSASAKKYIDMYKSIIK